MYSKLPSADVMNLCIICDMQNVVLATPIFCFPPAVRSSSQCIAHASLVSQTHLRKWVWLARLSACSSLLVETTF